MINLDPREQCDRTTNKQTRNKDIKTENRAKHNSDLRLTSRTATDKFLPTANEAGLLASAAITQIHKHPNGRPHSMINNDMTF